MAFVRKCPNCGLDVTDTSASKCPMCGASIGNTAQGKIWIIAFLQIAFSTIFMLAFGFPKFMMAIFVTLILIATALSARLKLKPVPATPAPQKPVIHPILLRIVGHATLISGIAFLAFLLFGFVMSMDAWNRWQRYEGQPYHQTEFQVVEAYWQPHRKGSPDVYARGNVDGAREWMSLGPYLHYVPRSQAELDSLVPAGTTIPIYLFPELKGRVRVVVVGDLPPAEASHRQLINTVKYSLLGLAVTAGIIFLLSRLRRLCYAEPTVQAMGMGAGSL